MCNIPTWPLSFLTNKQLLTIIADCTQALKPLSTKALPYKHTGAYYLQTMALKLLAERNPRV